MCYIGLLKFEQNRSLNFFFNFCKHCYPYRKGSPSQARGDATYRSTDWTSTCLFVRNSTEKRCSWRPTWDCGSVWPTRGIRGRGIAQATSHSAAGVSLRGAGGLTAESVSSRKPTNYTATPRRQISIRSIWTFKSTWNHSYKITGFLCNLCNHVQGLSFCEIKSIYKVYNFRFLIFFNYCHFAREHNMTVQYVSFMITKLNHFNHTVYKMILQY